MQAGEQIGRVSPYDHARALVGPAAGHIVVTPRPPVVEAQVFMSPNVAKPVLVHDQGYNCVALERPQRGRVMHEFHHVTHFTDWLAKRADASTTDVLVADDQIVAIMHPDSALPEKVKLDLSLTSTFTAWLNLMSSDSLCIDPRPKHQAIIDSQRLYLATLLMGYAFADQADRENLATALQHITGSTGSTTITQIGDAGNITAITETNAGETESQFPSQFDLDIQPWREVEGLNVALTVFLTPEIGSGGGVSFTLRCPGHEDEIDMARRALVEIVRLALPDFYVGAGKVVHATRDAEHVATEISGPSEGQVAEEIKAMADRLVETLQRYPAEAELQMAMEYCLAKKKDK